MELILQKDLPHQQAAIDAVSHVFEGVHISAPKQYFENTRISITDGVIEQNIRALQKTVRGRTVMMKNSLNMMRMPKKDKTNLFWTGQRRLLSPLI